MKLKSKLWIVPLVLLTQTGFIGGITTWHIVDPSRDANWILKQIKEGIIWAEGQAQKHAIKVQELEIANRRLISNDKNTSAIIRAKTTAISETQNAAAEDRYKNDWLTPEGICAYMKGAKNLWEEFTCNSTLESENSIISLIENALTKKPTHYVALNERISERMDNSTRETLEKQLLESYGELINETGINLNKFDHKSEAQFKDIEAVADLVFLKNTNAPDVYEILDTDHVDPTEFGDLQLSLLLRDVWLKEHRKLIVNQRTKTSESQTLIEIGKPEHEETRIRALHDATSAHEIQRQRALIKANELHGLLEKLEKQLTFETITAILALKLEG